MCKMVSTLRLDIRDKGTNSEVGKRNRRYQLCGWEIYNNSKYGKKKGDNNSEIGKETTTLGLEKRKGQQL